MPVFPAIFERVAGNLLSVDGSATQLPAILLGVDASLNQQLHNNKHQEYPHLFTYTLKKLKRPLSCPSFD